MTVLEARQNVLVAPYTRTAYGTTEMEARIFRRGMTLAEFNDHLDQSEPPPLVDSEPDSSDTESEANDDEQEIIAVAPDDMRLPQEFAQGNWMDPVHWDVSQAFDHYDISPDINCP